MRVNLPLLPVLPLLPFLRLYRLTVTGAGAGLTGAGLTGSGVGLLRPMFLRCKAFNIVTLCNTVALHITGTLLQAGRHKKRVCNSAKLASYYTPCKTLKMNHIPYYCKGAGNSKDLAVSRLRNLNMFAARQAVVIRIA